MLWELILLVNLIGLKDAQIAGKTLFLGVSEDVSEEIIIWIHRLSKERLPSPKNVGTTQSFEGLSRTEKWRMDWNGKRQEAGSVGEGVRFLSLYDNTSYDFGRS